jgi:hypothetical protein
MSIDASDVGDWYRPARNLRSANRLFIRQGRFNFVSTPDAVFDRLGRWWKVGLPAIGRPPSARTAIGRPQRAPSSWDKSLVLRPRLQDCADSNTEMGWPSGLRINDAGIRLLGAMARNSANWSPLEMLTDDIYGSLHSSRA